MKVILMLVVIFCTLAGCDDPQKKVPLEKARSTTKTDSLPIKAEKTEPPKSTRPKPKIARGKIMFDTADGVRDIRRDGRTIDFKVARNDQAVSDLIAFLVASGLKRFTESNTHKFCENEAACSDEWEVTMERASVMGNAPIRIAIRDAFGPFGRRIVGKNVVKRTEVCGQEPHAICFDKNSFTIFGSVPGHPSKIATEGEEGIRNKTNEGARFTTDLITAKTNEIFTGDEYVHYPGVACRYDWKRYERHTPTSCDIPESDDPCSVPCETRGACLEVNGRCLVRTRLLCELSWVCKYNGRCQIGDNECVSSCVETPNCIERGLCGLKDGDCVVPTIEGCKNSEACKRNGECHVFEDWNRCLTSRYIESHKALNNRD